MEPETRPAAIPDRDLDSLIPFRGGALSPFAILAWIAIAGAIVAAGWVVWSKLEISAKNYARAARKAVDEKDWAAALEAIPRVQGKTRVEPAFLRTLADYLEGTGTEPDLLVDVLGRLREAGRSLPADGVWLARAYLWGGRLSAARRALDQTPANLNESLDYLETKEAILKAEDRQREASVVEKQIFELHGNVPQVAVRKAISELHGTFLEIRQAAIGRLWELAKIPSAPGIAAIRALTPLQELSLQDGKQLLNLSDQHPDFPLRDRLNIVSRILSHSPSDRSQLISAELNRSAGKEHVRTLVAWLAREGEFDRILKLMPREELEKSKDLFPAVAHDLARREQWSELQELLEKGRTLPVSNARANVWRALAARGLAPGDGRQARAYLEEAIHESAAKKDAEALAGAFALAEEWNLLDLALDACLSLAVPSSKNEIELLERCWKLASALKNEPVLADVAKRMCGLRPDNVLFLKRHNYLRLLRGEDVEIIQIQNLGTTVRSSDLLLSALKAYRLNDFGPAADALQEIHNAADFSPGENAVYAGLLAIVKKEVSQAYRVAEGIRREVLLPDELTFLQMAL